MSLVPLILTSLTTPPIALEFFEHRMERGKIYVIWHNMRVCVCVARVVCSIQPTGGCNVASVRISCRKAGYYKHDLFVHSGELFPLC